MFARSFRRSTSLRGLAGDSISMFNTVLPTQGSQVANFDNLRADAAALYSAERQAPKYINTHAQLEQNALTFGVPSQYLTHGSVVTTERTQQQMYQALPIMAPSLTPTEFGDGTVLPMGTTMLSSAMRAAVTDALEPTVTSPPIVADMAARNGTQRVESGRVSANGNHTESQGFSLPLGLKGWHAALIIGGLIATGAGAYWLARR